MVSESQKESGMNLRQTAMTDQLLRASVRHMEKDARFLYFNIYFCN
jgi:hypothetical protein